MIHTDHQSLRHLKSQGKLNCRHAKWVEFIETFPYVIKYKQCKENIAIDALLWRYVLLNTLNTRLLRFKYLKELYPNDIDFDETYFQYELVTTNGFFRHPRFLFKDKRLYALHCLMRILLIREVYGGILMGHFRITKTLKVLH